MPEFLSSPFPCMPPQRKGRGLPGQDPERVASPQALEAGQDHCQGRALHPYESRKGAQPHVLRYEAL